jgi:hypothetical protein
LILHDTTEFSFKREDIRPIGMLNKGVAGEVLQLCSHPVVGWQNAPGIFGLWSIQVATI